MKREATRSILQAIRSVLDGKFHLSGKMAALMAEKFVEGRPRTAGPAIETLSDRELEVFQLLGRGYTTRQIADDLHVSFKTVQAFCARIKEKLRLANATELLREALRWHDQRQGK
jgi:DNA-binding NarL/FixJ family response regulator